MRHQPEHTSNISRQKTEPPCAESSDVAFGIKFAHTCSITNKPLLQFADLPVRIGTDAQTVFENINHSQAWRLMSRRASFRFFTESTSSALMVVIRPSGIQLHVQMDSRQKLCSHPSELDRADSQVLAASRRDDQCQAQL
ncbi:hypothetical protein KIN20_033560 [Parelaphostrongylus tenuis]|uniref:Uncharacterized protein n=1 Tax=Parelaphostrongylus tenuis TaxID=148309 RepID=A0AAD5WIY9_PARTN|nr:hypothetical protein KIN20_033560 [Parelaphostrongylus tenuis]